MRFHHSRAFIFGLAFHATAVFAQVSEDPKAVATQYFSFLSSGQFDKLMDLFDDNVVWHQPGSSHLSGTYQGKAAVGALFQRFMCLSQGTFKIEHVDDIMSQGSLAASTLRFSAHHGQGTVRMNGVDLMRTRNGKIAEVHLFSADQNAEDAFWDNAPRAECPK